MAPNEVNYFYFCTKVQILFSRTLKRSINKTIFLENSVYPYSWYCNLNVVTVLFCRWGLWCVNCISLHTGMHPCPAKRCVWHRTASDVSSCWEYCVLRSLPLIQGLLWPGLEIPLRLSCMGQIDWLRNKGYLILLNWKLFEEELCEAIIYRDEYNWLSDNISVQTDDLLN